jgi:hypothetical protein
VFPTELISEYQYAHTYVAANAANSSSSFPKANFIIMEAGQDKNEVAGPSNSNPTSVTLLFIDMADQSRASQASSRKKARSHIMNRRHQKTRMLRVSLQNETHGSYKNPE